MKTFRKSELKLNAERGTDRFGSETITIYKALQYRWEDSETADPQTGDGTYHLTKEEAIETAKKIKLDVGFTPMVDKIVIDYDVINEEFEFGETFELSDLDNYRRFNSDIETIWSGDENTGEELNPESIIVAFSHHMYMGYSYDIKSVDFVKNTSFKKEADLRNDSDTTRSVYFATFDDIYELAESFENGYYPFDKINSGSRIIREFLAENGHADYSELEETEEDI